MLVNYHALEYVVTRAASTQLDIAAVRDLEYQLWLEKKPLSSHLADILEARPALLGLHCPLPGRLALGAALSAWRRGDFDPRRIRRLCRHIDQLRPELLVRGLSPHFCDVFRLRLKQIWEASLSLYELTTDGRRSPAEDTVRVELLVRLALDQTELVRVLVGEIVGKPHRGIPQDLAARVRSVFDKAPKEPDIQTILVRSLSTPLPFSADLLARNDFMGAVELLERCITPDQVRGH